MTAAEVERGILPYLGKLLSTVKRSNIWQSVNFSHKPSFVLGSHDVRRGGTPKRATSSENFSWKRRFVLGSHVVRKGGTPKRATSR
ncbi:hypothetical protein V1477_017068 [Vespula maculifrons]|uniref:Ribosomal protein L2 n=1 Tax=Vespula maculifrons TaxID=7453 RepID=A0ABD2B4Y6_VESMC